MPSPQRRVRLESSHPLPILKVWFLLPDNSNVESFKVSLCERLAVLRDASISPGQLTLEVDGFELPGESTIDLIRETDIIMLKPSAQSLKRKATIQQKEQVSQKRMKLSTTTSSDSSSSSSSESSDSDSDTDTSSTSSSDSAPLPASSKLAVNNIKPIVHPLKARSAPACTISHTPNAQIQTIPPGMGKPSTQSRNKRRKIKRQASRATNAHCSISDDATALAPVAGSEHPSTSPKHNGTMQPVESAPQWQFETSVPRTLSSSLGNRNKSKAFKSAMENAIPQKTVFPGKQPQQVYFVPPSERGDLPPNIFVSSIDVEWRTGQGRSQSHRQEQQVEGPPLDALPTYPDEAQTPQTSNQDAIDWATVERRWSQYPTLDVSLIEKLLPTHIVAWKAFGLDPVSLTPQSSMLHMARVITVADHTILVSLLVRPGIGQAAFGRASFNDGDSPEEEQASFPLTEILGWKLINAQQPQTLH
ncbi:hypothetical protein BU17DRAFT_93130 [Hysterangium stoloniferum]|nr:hypothetical protein BU17DRAFT_93130 [Hysterangium stoloniferum]